jgi:hypothetical protein
LSTQSSPGWDPSTISFPLSKHAGGGDTAPAFSGLHVYLQFTWEVGLPTSPVEFSSHCHFFFYSYVHTRLGSFLPPAPTPSLTTHKAPSLSPQPPQYPAETILPLFLILL